MANSPASNLSIGPQRHAAYVLLIVIATLVVCLTTLSGLSRSTLRATIQATELERSMQRRCGMNSLQERFFPQAQRIFERAAVAYEDLPQPPPPTQRTALTFGSVTYDIMLGDEDAKLNLNVLYRLDGRQRTEATMRKLLPGVGLGVIRMRPAATGGDASVIDSASGQPSADVRNAFRSWGQVFDLPQLHRVTGSSLTLPALTQQLTIDGGGTLNLTRATDLAITKIATTVLGDAGAKRFVDRYRDSPLSDLEILLVTEVKSRRNQERLRRLLGRTSLNFSMWINASTEVGRDARSFIVSNVDAEGDVHLQKFVY